MIDADTIHDYLDGELDETKARELAQWLLATPENRALFRREVALAATLSERAVTRAATTTPSRATATVPQSGTSTRARTQTGKHRAKRHQRPQRPRLIPALVAFGAMAAVVVISVVLVMQHSAAARPASTQDLVISDVHGTVSVVRGNATLARLPIALHTGDQLRIGPNSAVRLEMDHGRTRVWAGADTTMVIVSIRESRERSGTRLHLAHGNLLIDAAPQPTTAPLRIRSARSEAEVVGTVLAFVTFPDRDRLVVGHGVVAYGQTTDDRRSQVTAGGFGESDGSRLIVGRLDYQPPAAVTTARVSGFSLVDDSTGKPIPGYAQLESGSVLDLAGLHGRKINLRANVIWPPAVVPGHVVFHYDDNKPIAEGGAPYTLLSDVPPLAAAVPPERFHNGIHALVATPYASDISNHPPSERPIGGTGAPGHSATLIFTVINATP